MTHPEKNPDLSARIDQLEARVDRVVKSLREYIDLVESHVKMVEGDQMDAWERIKQLELAVYPHLQPTLRQLYNTIGDGANTAEPPADRRTP